MTDHDNSQGEPTMEEILASIRRIISEDNDESQAPAKPEVRAVESGQEPKGPEVRHNDSEVLELSPSQVVKEDRPETVATFGKPNGLDRSAAEETPQRPAEAAPEAAEPKREEPAVQNTAAVAPAPQRDDNEIEETLLSPEVATAAAAAFGALSKDVVISRSADSRSLEELVKEMMKPMLKEWLDENLPPLVEEVVEREVRRLSHRRVRR